MYRTTKKILLCITALILLFGMLVGAAALFGINLNFYNGPYADNSLDQLSSSDINYYVDAVDENSDIKLEVIKAVSDTFRTVIQIKVTGRLSGRGSPDISSSDVFLTDEYGQKYEVDTLGAGNEYELAIADVCPIVFNDGPKTKCNMTLVINKINGIDGPWHVEFELSPNVDTKHFLSNTAFKFENGTDLMITDITCYLTSVCVEGSYKKFIGNESTDRRPSVPYSIILYVDGRKHTSIREGVVDFKTFYATYEPININLDSKVELEFQLDRIPGEDGMDHPDENNIIRKQINLISTDN